MTDARHDLDAVLDAATAAAGPYGALDGQARAAFLSEIAGQLESRGDALVETAHRETALGMERLRAELARTASQLRMFAALVANGSWAGARIDSGPPALRRLLVPIGPVVVFGASNFPLAFSVAGGDTTSALAAGCPVICKAHPAHRDTSVVSAAAIDAAVAASGLASGVFGLVATAAGDSDVEFGRRLVADDRIEAVAIERGQQTLLTRQSLRIFARLAIGRVGQWTLCLRAFEQLLPEERHHRVRVCLVERDQRFE